jgi:cell division protein ZapA
MTKAKSYTIRLLNKSYEIKCLEDEADNLDSAAEQLNKYMLEYKNQFKQLDDFQSLLLAALHISEKLNNSQEQIIGRQKELTQFISSLEHKINQVTAGETSS